MSTAATQLESIRRSKAGIRQQLEVADLDFETQERVLGNWAAAETAAARARTKLVQALVLSIPSEEAELLASNEDKLAQLLAYLGYQSLLSNDEQDTQA